MCTPRRSVHMSRQFVKGYSGTIASLVLIGAIALPSDAQQPPDQGGFVEVAWMKVKQDRVGEFGEIGRRIADANRQGKGDNWTAYTDFYGTDQYVAMASIRETADDGEGSRREQAGTG